MVAVIFSALVDISMTSVENMLMVELQANTFGSWDKPCKKFTGFLLGVEMLVRIFLFVRTALRSKIVGMLVQVDVFCIFNESHAYSCWARFRFR